MIFPQGEDRITKSPPAVDKAERRRQQNRSSQIAFRERSKTTLKTLQEALNQSQSENEALYTIMEELLERTEHLKRTIEDVLRSRLKSSQSESFSSPQSSSCYALN